MSGVALAAAPAARKPVASQLDPSQLNVETISTYQGFRNLEPVWNRLVEQVRPSHPFLEYQWARTWWECFGNGSTLHVLLVKSGDQPVGIAPLIRSTIRMWGIPVRRLGFFYNDHVPRTDFIIARGHKDVYRKVWEHLVRGPRWDLLQLCQLAESSETLAEVSTLAFRSGCHVGTWASGDAPYINVCGSWEEYLGSLSAKHRSNLRNRAKRLHQIGSVECETTGRSPKLSAVDLDNAIDDALRLESAAWKGAAGTAINCDERIRRFYTEFAHRAAERGWLRLHFLKAGTDRIASDYSLSYNNRVFLLKLGYNPAFAPYSPSNLLLSNVLQDSFERGTEEYDFLGQNAEWKQVWTKKATPHQWLFAFDNGFKGRLLHSIKFGLIPALKKARSISAKCGQEAGQ